MTAATNTIREGSAPNFCPPVEEGVVFTFQDEQGDLLQLEFLGLLLHGEPARRYGFFFQVSDDVAALESGEVVVLEVAELDADGQPAAFEAIDDEGILQKVYAEFQNATRDLYRFE